MYDQTTRRLFDEIAATLDIPESAYDKAKKRYEDIGTWFARPQAHCRAHAPNIYPQGSFRLGTVVRPLVETAEYDLDMGCRLDFGITKWTHSQKDLKTLVRKDLEEYRIARQIEEELGEKCRCWRLSYADQLRFHIDAVPSIPEDETTRLHLKEVMTKYGSADLLAERIAKLAGAITDNRTPHYDKINPDWRISNSKGYALWFEERIKLAPQVLQKRAAAMGRASIDELPAAEWRSPLQQAIKFLKRHRDVMYADDLDSAPISIIITTLAASAYQGEAEIADALQRILTDMDSYIRSTLPRVPNPVNPEEDFADKWHDQEYRHLGLEAHFHAWLNQARKDFASLTTSRDAQFLNEQIKRKVGSHFGAESLRDRLGLGAPAIMTMPKTQVISNAPPPWQKDE